MSMLQRSDEWFEARKGRFTASRISELLGVKGLNLTGESYAFSLAVDLFAGVDANESFLSFDMQRGVELEPLAFNKFKELKGIDFLDVTECGFFNYGNDAGASPDGLVSDGAILEIKCPKPEKFFRLVCDSIIDQKYQDQMQMQMLATGKGKAYFFNYIIYNGVEHWLTIEVQRDEKRIELIKERIEQAAQVRDSFIEQLKLNNQFLLINS